mmetsp:Transcript_6009/g.21208  ORF Transcript_6009/g.21208 Transcript_6009/m.21208 type:complete len:258 (-) Transcript_6009:21-794(-)
MRETGLTMVSLGFEVSFSDGRFQVGLDPPVPERDEFDLLLFNIHGDAVHELFLDEVSNFFLLATVVPEDIVQTIGQPRHDFPGPFELFELLLVSFFHDPRGTSHHDRRAEDQDAPFICSDTAPIPAQELPCGRTRPHVGRQGHCEQEIRRATHQHAQRARVLRFLHHGAATTCAGPTSELVRETVRSFVRSFPSPTLVVRHPTRSFHWTIRRLPPTLAFLRHGWHASWCTRDTLPPPTTTGTWTIRSGTTVPPPPVR